MTRRRRASSWAYALLHRSTLLPFFYRRYEFGGAYQSGEWWRPTAPSKAPTGLLERTDEMKCAPATLSRRGIEGANLINHHTNYHYKRDTYED